MSNSTEEISSLNPILSVISPHQKIKKKRNMPGNPDPEAEVIALTPKDLLTTNRFICEICNKGFQRDQNLQLHRRGHNLPWKLRQKVVGAEIKKRVYVCPEPSCVHHHPSRALGDLTGIKKHFSRKHGEKRWKCEKCSKRYAVQSDWKAHSKLCGTREYKCDCGTLFTRKDSFITHRAFCDALAEESARLISSTRSPPPPLLQQQQLPPPLLFPLQNPTTWAPLPSSNPKPELMNSPFLHQYNTTMLSHMPATALLQKACNLGSAAISSAKQTQPVGNTLSSSSSVTHLGTGMPLALGYKSFASLQKNEGMTRDFLGLASECGGGNMHWKHLLSLEDFSTYDGDYPLLVRGGVGMGLDEFTSKTWGDCSKLDPT